MDGGTAWDLSKPVYIGATTGMATVGLLTSKEALTWKAVREHLEELCDLSSGWDDDDAEAPRIDIINSAFFLLDWLEDKGFPAPTRTVPTVEGGVVVEWHLAKRYLEVEIDQPFCGEFMDKRESAPASHYPLCWGELESREGSEVDRWADVISLAAVGFARQSRVVR